jgi:hypothetical protein
MGAFLGTVGKVAMGAIGGGISALTGGNPSMGSAGGNQQNLSQADQQMAQYQQYQQAMNQLSEKYGAMAAAESAIHGAIQQMLQGIK